MYCVLFCVVFLIGASVNGVSLDRATADLEEYYANKYGSPTLSQPANRTLRMTNNDPESRISDMADVPPEYEITSPGSESNTETYIPPDDLLHELYLNHSLTQSNPGPVLLTESGSSGNSPGLENQSPLDVSTNNSTSNKTGTSTFDDRYLPVTYLENTVDRDQNATNRDKLGELPPKNKNSLKHNTPKGHNIIIPTSETNASSKNVLSSCLVLMVVGIYIFR